MGQPLPLTKTGTGVRYSLKKQMPGVHSGLVPGASLRARGQESRRLSGRGSGSTSLNSKNGHRDFPEASSLRCRAPQPTAVSHRVPVCPSAGKETEVGESLHGNWDQGPWFQSGHPTGPAGAPRDSQGRSFFTGSVFKGISQLTAVNSHQGEQTRRELAGVSDRLLRTHWHQRLTS